jgi:hypothetical protein
LLVLAVVVLGCGGDDDGRAADGGGDADAGRVDAGARDASTLDGGSDAGTEDAGGVDAAAKDAGVDAGGPDAGPPDAGPPDAGPPDAGPPDAGPTCATANRLANGTFDTTVAPWVAAFPSVNTVTHDTLDASGSATSGSLRSRTTRALNQRDPTSVCIPVTAGASVTFGALARIAPSAAASGDVEVTLNFYGMASCGGAFLTTHSSPSTSTEGVFQSLSVSATAPSGTVSMRAFFDVYRRAGTELTTNWDDACVLAL